MKYLLQRQTPFGGRRFLHAFLFLLMLSVSIVACKKGDNGTPGDTGPAGPAGPAGPKGDSGTANVYYSDWFTPTPWTKDTVFQIWHFYYDQAAASITESIVENGSVLVYGKLLGYNVLIWPKTQVSLMPISLTYVQGVTMTDTWSALASPGNLRIDFQNSNNYWTAIATSHQFRYIVIPGGVKLAGSLPSEKDGHTETNQIGGTKAASGWNALTYEQVCEKLHIPE